MPAAIIAQQISEAGNGPSSENMVRNTSLNGTGGERGWCGLPQPHAAAFQHSQ